jgi:hypothetical protein
MISEPRSAAAFLEGRRIVVAGVSRSGTTPAKAIFRRLRDTGHDCYERGIRHIWFHRSLMHWLPCA